MTLLKKAIATAALFLASAVAAVAFPAVATNNAAVRAGPGNEYPVVDRLYPGERVDVVERRGSWYLISGDGWVRTSSLDALGRSYYSEPSYYYGPSYSYRDYDRWDYKPRRYHGGHHSGGHHGGGNHHSKNRNNPNPPPGRNYFNKNWRTGSGGASR